MYLQSAFLKPHFGDIRATRTPIVYTEPDRPVTRKERLKKHELTVFIKKRVFDTLGVSPDDFVDPPKETKPGSGEFALYLSGDHRNKFEQSFKPALLALRNALKPAKATPEQVEKLYTDLRIPLLTQLPLKEGKHFKALG